MNTQIAAQNIVLLDALQAVLQRLDAGGVSPILLKGAALLQTVYPGIADRAMADVDLLIRETDIGATRECLLELGYSEVMGEDFVFVKQQGPYRILLDIHYAVWYLTGDDWRTLWTRTRLVHRNGLRCRVFPPEEMLIHSAAHAAVHAGKIAPTTLADVAMICGAREPAMEWRVFCDRVLHYGLGVPLYHVLSEARSANHVPIPDEVFRRLRPVSRSAVLQYRLLLHCLRTGPIPNIGHLLEFIFQKGAGNRTRTLLRKLFPPGDFIRRRYDTRMGWRIVAMRLLRPFRLAGAFVRLLLSLILNKWTEIRPNKV
ncbi:MAG: nucleotidyltransferase family protein [Lentisphaerae bacterium]|nr:nucleotidyltransferase family protein [Lentisphaerota bacterium]